MTGPRCILCDDHEWVFERKPDRPGLATMPAGTALAHLPVHPRQLDLYSTSRGIAEIARSIPQGTFGLPLPSEDGVPNRGRRHDLSSPTCDVDGRI